MGKLVRTRTRLLETRVFGSGVILLRYETQS